MREEAALRNGTQGRLFVILLRNNSQSRDASGMPFVLQIVTLTFRIADGYFDPEKLDLAFPFSPTKA